MRRRNYLPSLSALWNLRFPGRPPKTEFSDEVTIAVEFLMLQIDPTGKKPVILPPMPAEDYVPDSVVKPTGGRGTLAE
jgi:hypothetical protein